MTKRVSRALISVTVKQGLEPLVRLLAQHGVELIASGGTATFIRDLGFPVIPVEDLTASPEILGGRVKTLHPAVHGAILARSDSPTDKQDLDRLAIAPIDLVIVDLYPFSDAVASGVSHEQVIENIDIGGVALIRAAAKNYKDVLVLASHADYGLLYQLFSGGETAQLISSLSQRLLFANRAFMRVAEYDAAIASYFNEQSTLSESGVPESEDQSQGCFSPQWPLLHLSPLQAEDKTLRYGENPHQRAFFSGDLSDFAIQHHGRAPSYNNLLDLDAAVNLIDEFPGCGAITIVKHGNPCGLALSNDLTQAWEAALSGDPESAYGGIICVGGSIDEQLAHCIDSIFFEVCLAEGYTGEALQILGRRRNPILLERRMPRSAMPAYRLRSALHAYLVQERDAENYQLPIPECVTKRTTVSLTAKQIEDIDLANRIAKHVVSNAIVLVREGRLIGVGAGFSSRVDATRHAIDKAHRMGHDTKGSVLASDAFFPFPDSVELAAQAGIVAIVQPGGSIRDDEVTQVANRCGLVMLHTHMRHFRH